jgi:hypothetical protein
MHPDPVHDVEPVFLVEGPKWDSAQFLGQGLLAAAKANELWVESFEDPIFMKCVDRLTVCYVPDFGDAAKAFLLMHLKERSAYFVVPLNSEDAEPFAIMAAMGFFNGEGPIHKMVIPSELTIAKVKAALLKLAETEDKNCALHPEYLVASMSFSEAAAYQRRQIAMDDFQRDDTTKSVAPGSSIH